MGSVSDMETMAGARDMLEELDIPFEMRVISAHRTPEEMFDYAEEAARARASASSSRAPAARRIFRG